MNYFTQLRVKSLFEQMGAIKRGFPDFNVRVESNKLIINGQIKPTARSVSYTVQIEYQCKNVPRVKVLNPKLVKNFNNEEIPHIFPGKILCLYMAKYREFQFSDFISQTIIPWTSLWLYHYEVWHTSGSWLGGGEHPSKK